VWGKPTAGAAKKLDAEHRKVLVAEFPDMDFLP
jgi:hypothetical protein